MKSRPIPPRPALPVRSVALSVCVSPPVFNGNATSGDNQPLPLDRFVTRAQLCAALKIHRQTVRRWTQGGKLPTYAVGRCLRYRIADVEQLLREAQYTRRKKPGPKPKASP